MSGGDAPNKRVSSLAGSALESSENLILITDDDSFNVLAMQSLLTQFNVQADVASDAQQALQMVQTRHENP